jgi:AcrR family transcriptional regulator
MNGTRPYRMGTRAAAVGVTRERILQAACEAFVHDWYDEVTLRHVAADAGVALQTLVNHFGNKETLFVAAAERISDTISTLRSTVAVGDLAAAAATLVDDYEQTGEFTLRTLAIEERVPVVRPGIDRGRRRHEQWVEHVFAAALTGLSGVARERRVAQLVVATDVFTWKLLRRDKALSRDQTIVAIRELLEALHTHTGGGST